LYILIELIQIKTSLSVFAAIVHQLNIFSIVSISFQNRWLMWYTYNWWWYKNKAVRISTKSLDIWNRQWSLYRV